MNQKSPNPDCSCIISREKKNEKKVDLQIVVPAYNVATYIDRCLNSVLGQDTEYSYQLVVVDDGSTDQTPSIVDQYDKYSNVTIIHQKNKGLSGARNRGLENLIGEYVMFLDSDDALVPGAVDQLMGAAYHDDADIVEGGFDYIIRDSRKKGLYHKCGDNYYDITLMQIKTNFNRVLCRGVQIRHSVFIASVGLINKYFDKCTTNNQKLKHIEFALKNSDYNYFVFSCAEL